MMNSESRKELPEDGQAAYFVQLHLDTTRLERKHPHKANEWIYEVEGKPRPMLVIKRLTKKERGKHWFLALPITKKGSDESGRTRDDYVLIGNCLHEKKISFVKMELHRIPENLLHQDDDRPPIIIPCDQISFQSAVKVLNHMVLQGKTRLMPCWGV